MVMGCPLSTVYLFKLEQKYNPETWRERPETQNLVEYLKSEQRVSGQIQTNEIPYSAPLWALSQYEPNSVATQNAIDYLKLRIDSEDWSNSFQGVQRLAIGALVLCEDDFNEHEETLRSVGTQLEETIDEFIDSRLNDDRTPRYEKAACVLMALYKLPESHTRMTQRLVENIQSAQKKDGYWYDEQFVRQSATIALGLISVGGGPRIPAHDVEWQRTLDKQARRRSRPQFVSTFPAKAGAASTTGIYNKSKSLISSTSHELKIGSLYIDMLYDEILDLSREHPNLEIKILTRGRNVTGNRQRIQKSVLDKLIEATDGNVRENHRLHCRLVVSDEDAMVISSADLTRDQLRDQFNAGIYTSDPTAIAETAEFFDEIWKESDRVDHS